jgi:hypothetical protein
MRMLHSRWERDRNWERGRMGVRFIVGLNIKNTEGSIYLTVFVGLNPGIPKLKAWKGKKTTIRAIR